jgi:hypothetical protein
MMNPTYQKLFSSEPYIKSHEGKSFRWLTHIHIHSLYHRSHMSSIWNQPRPGIFHVEYGPESW